MLADKKIAVGYCRFSSENQREESIDSQQRNIKNYAHKEGYQIIDWYIDKALSGTTDKRPQFKKMVEQAKKGKFRTILVNKLDRFSRDKWGSQFYKFELSKHSVVVRSVTEPIDDSPAGKMMESMLEGMAQFYSDNLSQEVKRGMNENAYNAVFNGGTVPFGYKKIPRLDKVTGLPIFTKKRGMACHDIALCEHESEGVKLIFDRALAGKQLLEICQELTEKGYRTRLGNVFRSSALEVILRNEKYMGTYTFNKRKNIRTFEGGKQQRKNDEENIIKIEDGVPAIVSKETFEAVQRLMDGRKYKSGRTRDEYLLVGKIKCGECEDTYRGARKGKKYGKGYYQYYTCQAPRRCLETGKKLEFDDRCRNHAIGRVAVERFVINEIRELVFDVTNIENVMNLYNEYISQTSDNNDAIIRRLEIELEDINRKIDMAVDKIMLEQDPNLSEKMRDRVIAFEAEKENLKHRLTLEYEQRSQVFVTSKDFKKAFTKARELLTKGGFENQKRIVDMFLNKVLVFHDRVEVYTNILPNFILGGLKTEIDIKTLQNWSNSNQNDQQDNEKDLPRGLFVLDDVPKSLLIKHHGG